MDKSTRNLIQKATQDARRLLEAEFGQQLEGLFDILPDGTIAQAPGKHLDANQRIVRQKIVTAIEYDKKSNSVSGKEAVATYLREISFTYLNRFVALKMLEARGLTQECVSKGEQSSGFKEFIGLAPGLSELPDRGYRLYVESLFDELSIEIKVLFDPQNPSSLLWPRRKVLDQLLSILNREEIWDIWSEDETIGWVYQYFNSGEERKKMREESAVPRNSRELAVRNQFFTPRYVVEFLTDNTLGRIWYDMRKGNTVLKEECCFLFRGLNEIFLLPGEKAPFESEDETDLSQEELLKKTVHIEHRNKKDPRDLRVLDPACGSGHFLLYAFDLLERIYEEAWEDPESPKSEVTGRTLRENFDTLDDLRWTVPKLIIEHNLHGIDIDPRSVQIAVLALWLRAQKTWKNLGINADERPQITKSNIVTAEPMPGEEDMRHEFTASMKPRALGQLVDVVFDKMKLAGEAGFLLKIEEEIKDAVTDAKKQWMEGTQLEQLSLLPGIVSPQPKKQELRFDFKGIADEQFWEQAEDRILDVLKDYAERTINGHSIRRRLFAEDSARGFAFIDLCRKRYDVVLMNPPFGSPTVKTKSLINDKYKGAHNDIFAAFIRRAKLIVNKGRIGGITSRSFMVNKRLENYRRTDIIPSLEILLDLGLGVMDDAFVESSAFILYKATPSHESVSFFDCRDIHSSRKSAVALSSISKSKAIVWHRNFFQALPQAKLLYDLPISIAALLRDSTRFEPIAGTAREGMKSFDNFRYLRLRWEVPFSEIGHGNRWQWFAKGGSHAFFYSDLNLVLDWDKEGAALKETNMQINGTTAQVRQASNYWFQRGVTYTRRSAKGFSARVLPEGCIFTDRGPAVLPNEGIDSKYLLGWLNCKLIRTLIHLQASASDFLTGILKMLPWCDPDKITLYTVKEAIDNILSIELYSACLRETSPYFTGPIYGNYSDVALKREKLYRNIAVARKSALSACDIAIANLYNISDLKWTEDILNEKDSNADAITNDDEECEEKDNYQIRVNHIREVISFAVGVALGRWEKRVNSNLVSEVDPFETPPAVPPVICNHNDSTSGILTDDAGSENDIVKRTNEILIPMHNLSIEALHEFVNPLLGEKSLREFLRHDFWGLHLSQYTNSRRKAPIYWMLSTASGNYSIWIYYHRFTVDTFYKILNDFITPKLNYEERKLTGLVKEAGANPAANMRKEISEQESFIEELRGFREEIARIAPLWNPNLNDGVIINSAPLWRLVPHHKPWQKECKKVWDELHRGDHDWAHLAMHLWPDRIVPKCAKDLGLAIAHGLEETFWEEDEKGKGKPRKVSKETLDALIQERTSPTVKAALEDLLKAPIPANMAGKKRKKKA